MTGGSAGRRGGAKAYGGCRFESVLVIRSSGIRDGQMIAYVNSLMGRSGVR
jgi:hypothetical protein